MFQQAALEKLEDYFTPLAQRPRRCVYFYRLGGLTPGSRAFLGRYYQAARENGVILDGRLANPGPDQLAYYTEMMGTEFRLDRGFLDKSLARWLPRMSPAQRERVTEAIFSTLNDMRGQGKNDNMLRNGYMKYMCWLYYKFERILNRLGAEAVPKILYDGALSQHELQLLVILSRAGADIVALEREEGYLRLDPRSEWSRQWREEGQEPISPSFTLKGLQEGLRREMDRQRLYGPPPAAEGCTNAWMERPALDQLLTPPRERGGGEGHFCNAFLAQYGAEDKLTYPSELFSLYRKLTGQGRRVCAVSGGIPAPTPEEVAGLQRGQYQAPEQLAGGLVRNIRCPGQGELQRLMTRAFVDLVLEEGEVPMPRRTNGAVYLLCWLRRYQKELFPSGWKPGEIPVFFLFGSCSEHEGRFLRLLAGLPVDVVLLMPDRSKQSSLRDARLLELRYEDSLVMDAFPAEQSQVRVSTAAYQAERELDSLLYQDSGMYRTQQYARAESVTLRVMYEEIALLWDQELKYRPSFQTENGVVTIPVLLEKICGVRDGQLNPYWQDIKKLMTPDTLVVTQVPWATGGEESPLKPHVTRFLQNKKLLRNRIKEHKNYPYGILREDMQDYLLDKLQLLLDRRSVAGIFQNGTEYTAITVALSLSKELLRMIQRFDFTKKNPKLIVINTTEQVLSLEDSILTAFLNLVGFDILFFVPTGYRCIEGHFAKPFANEQQIGEYLYDLIPPNFSALQSRGRHPIRKFFGRSD